MGWPMPDGSTGRPIARSASAERQRRARQRRKLGLSVYPVELPDAEVEDALMRFGHLATSDVDNRAAVELALGAMVARMLARLLLRL
jgi:hypothetical protein